MDQWLLLLVILGAIVLWVSRKLIPAFLSKIVEHEFEEKLEGVRADFHKRAEEFKAALRLKEQEITDLRSGAMTAMASRQMAFDKRRLEAVDQLWSSVTALAGAKNISEWMATVKFDATADEAEKNPQLREIFTKIGAEFDPPNKLDLSSAAKARPFVSPMA